jgi:NAD(P)-dependent dehydrogenase (short-subunit alcohol dehydrogenase family)
MTMTKPNRGVALVTGASAGIGRATAEALRDAGYRVFGTSRKPVPQRFDGITMLMGDVTGDASVKKLVDDVLSEAGRIDLLVNNAGVGLFGGAEESSVAQVQALFDVNVFGVIRMTNAVLPSMRRSGEGRIINMLYLRRTPLTTRRPSTRSKAIRNRSITRFVSSIFASRSSSRHSSVPFLTRMELSRIPC